MKDIKEHQMQPEPEYIKASYLGSGKLQDKKVIISGGDSGIGRAIAVHFAREGADLAILYHDSHTDAQDTKALVEAEEAKCLLYSLDISNKEAVNTIVEDILTQFKTIDVLINNAAIQQPQKSLLDISLEQLHRTFAINIYGYFYLTQAVLDHMPEGASIVNTASVVAYRGHEILLDYASTKGAILGFTRSLAVNLAGKKIRVNGVAPGPIWTPLIPSTFSEEKVSRFGKDTPLGRPGQPAEVAPAYVYLASDDSSYVTGQIIHVNGGEIVGG